MCKAATMGASATRPWGFQESFEPPAPRGRANGESIETRLRCPIIRCLTTAGKIAGAASKLLEGGRFEPARESPFLLRGEEVRDGIHGTAALRVSGRAPGGQSAPLRRPRGLQQIRAYAAQRTSAIVCSRVLLVRTVCDSHSAGPEGDAGKPR